MDNERFAKKCFIVAGASGIRVSIEFLNANYKRPEFTPDSTTGDKGQLLLCRIDPVYTGLPAFNVRVGHDKPEEVDIDLIGDKAQQKAFATSAPGYIGHKTEPLNTDPRSYKLHIEVPSVGHVLSGVLIIKGLGMGVRLCSALQMHGRLDAVVIRKRDIPTETG